MSVVGELALIAFFAAWFAISVVTHVSSGLNVRMWPAQRLGLVPHWNFFAPNPGVHDLHLLYRDVMNSGETSALGFVDVIEARRWYHAVWHPRKYRNKVVSDVTLALQTMAREIHEQGGDQRALLLSSAYVVAVHLVMRMPRAPDARARQFILARHSSYGRDPEHDVIFLSEFHPFAAPKLAEVT